MEVLIDAQERARLKYISPRDKGQRRTDLLERYGYNNMFEFDFFFKKLLGDEPGSYVDSLIIKDSTYWMKSNGRGDGIT